ncbi:hypothetical protein ACWD7B_20950 [Streptomyces rubiginosohelvolus]|uniref:hypothetical protein n=1 Tax=Streptomyces rubiginosohelvolus TaxID=67362 RepID=UPI0033B669A6
MAETEPSQAAASPIGTTADRPAAANNQTTTAGNGAASNSATATVDPSIDGESPREEALGKVIHWLFFGVIFAIMPILAGMLINVSRGEGVGFWELIGRGELLIVTAGLAAAAAGQILTKKTPSRKLTANLLAFGNIVIACLTSIVFANISSGFQSGDQIDQHAVGIQSLWFFGITFLTAGSSALIVELEGL